MEDIMQKTSKAFQLDPMPDPVLIKLCKKDKKWYPIDTSYTDKGKNFIYGQGWVKTDKWKEHTIQPLSNPFTAKEVKDVADEFGLNAAMGMIQGWGRGCLFHDRSYGLDYTKMEVANMATLGELYDTYTDLVQSVGDEFIANLLKKGFKLEGSIEKGWLWYNSDENNPGNLVGQVGIYETVWLHPLQHVDHCIGGRILGGRVLPMFNPISFDSMLMTLFFYKYYSKDYKRSDKMLAKIVSVHDRIAHLTTKTIADKFHRIFEAQELLKIVEIVEKVEIIEKAA